MKGLRLLVFLGALNLAAVDPERAVQAIVCEAANQGFDGMTAVGEVIRNRDSLKGFSCLKRADLSSFLSRQPSYVFREAERAWARSQASKLALGATHYENVKAFGLPLWAQGMKETARLGDHVFFKEKT